MLRRREQGQHWWVPIGTDNVFGRAT